MTAHAAGNAPRWLPPAEAAAYLGVPSDELLRLVADARLTAHQLPGGILAFFVTDLDALRTPVPADEAARLLSNLFSKDNTMQVAMFAPKDAVASIDVRQLFQKIEELINETRRKAAVAPQWLDIDDAVTCFGAPAKTIKEWASDGYVRKSKLGPTFQSKALYNADDISDVLNRIAAGKTPVVALREVG